MATFTFVVPVLPGKEDTDRETMQRFATGEEKDAYDASRRSLGFKREAIRHQTSMPKPAAHRPTGHRSPLLVRSSGWWSLVAGGQGFEPWSPVTGTNGFQDRRLRPLGHPPGEGRYRPCPAKTTIRSEGNRSTRGMQPGSDWGRSAIRSMASAMRVMFRCTSRNIRTCHRKARAMITMKIRTPAMENTKPAIRAPSSASSMRHSFRRAPFNADAGDGALSARRKSTYVG